ncbi:MAG: DNA polymerase III subunit gamma/tau, partial [Spirochaetota bacterium]
MSHVVTANKYRPQNFDELIGQEFVASSLKNSINKKRIANAYLLSGPRGVGKTSAARIIAKALNCINGPTGTPCNSCENCITITQGYNTDVIEIDGASNTSINDVKIIQEEILYPPVKSKYKVYIIDEVHMLSKSAFNALLKTIEEPPEFVVFIFATTEINKVIPTIRSRCQQFNFRLIPTDLIFNSLAKVLKESNISYEEDAILWIANEGKGSMRDAYTLLDQIISFCDNGITLEKIRDKLGIIGEERIAELIKGIIEKDRTKVLSEYLSIIEDGVSCEQIITELLQFFRNILFIKSNLSNNKFINCNPKLFDKTLIDAFSFENIENIFDLLFKAYENSKFSMNFQTELEATLIKLT